MVSKLNRVQVRFKVLHVFGECSKWIFEMGLSPCSSKAKIIYPIQNRLLYIKSFLSKWLNSTRSDNTLLYNFILNTSEFLCWKKSSSSALSYIVSINPVNNEEMVDRSQLCISHSNFHCSFYPEKPSDELT